MAVEDEPADLLEDLIHAEAGPDAKLRADLALLLPVMRQLVKLEAANNTLIHRVLERLDELGGLKA